MKIKKGDRVQVCLKDLSEDDKAEIEDIIAYDGHIGVVSKISDDEYNYNHNCYMTVNFGTNHPENEPMETDFFLRELKKIKPEIDKDGNIN